MTPLVFMGLSKQEQRLYLKKTSRCETLVKEIKRIIGEELEMSFEECDIDSRKQELAEARHAYRYYIKHYTTMSLKRIGKLWKTNRHHTTIISSIRKWEDLIKVDRDIRELDMIITAKLKTYYE